MIGAAAGLALRYVGLLRSAAGKSERLALIAPCTSRAAESILRFKSNCKLMRVWPLLLDEVISLTPEITPKRRSSGVATLDAMVSGLAPGMAALTVMTGKSTWGSGETGRFRKAPMPDKAMPMVSNTVATGRRMKRAERFIWCPLVATALFFSTWCLARSAGGCPAATHFLLLRQKKVSKEKATRSLGRFAVP